MHAAKVAAKVVAAGTELKVTRIQHCQDSTLNQEGLWCLFYTYGGREGPTAPAIRSCQIASSCVTYRARQLYVACGNYMSRAAINKSLAAINMPRAAYGKFKPPAVVFSCTRQLICRLRQLVCRARLMGNSNRHFFPHAAY